jgi:ASC-1-like (ASCH) protein
MISDQGIENVLPDQGILNVDDAVKIYHEYYTTEDIEKYGVLGIQIRTI